MAFRSSSSLTPGGVNGAAIPVPAGAASGDIAVVGIYIEATSTITPPAGFTLKSNLRTSATARGGLVVYWKRLTGADSGTYTFTWSGTPWRGAVCGLWSGRIASGDPFDGTVGTAESTTTVSTLNVSTSPAGANGDALGMWTNFNGGTSWTPPTNYTERVDTNVITLDTRDAVASGSTGNITATSTITDFEKAFLGVLAVASAGGTTGTIAATQDGNTAAASGQLGYSGTIAVTQAAQIAAATGQLGYSGTAAATQANQTASAVGQLGYSGAAASTQANQTASASGTFTPPGAVSGSIVAPQANQTAVASGQLRYSGTATASQANQTAVVIGKLGYTGTAAAIQANNTATASGTVANSISGTIATTQANQTASATGVNQPLVLFGTSSAGVGTTPSSHPNKGLAPFSIPATTPTGSASAARSDGPTTTPAAVTAPSASAASGGAPTSTGG